MCGCWTRSSRASTGALRCRATSPATRSASAADLKFLQRLPQAGRGTSNRKAMLERDDFSCARHPALAYWWSVIFSENRYPLFGIMLEGEASEGCRNAGCKSHCLPNENFMMQKSLTRPCTDKFFLVRSDPDSDAKADALNHGGRLDVASRARSAENRPGPLSATADKAGRNGPGRDRRLCNVRWPRHGEAYVP